MKLLHNGGRRDELKNHRPIARISVIYKFCVLMVRERTDKWKEDSRLLGEIQGGFRRGRRTEDKLFMLESRSRRRKEWRFQEHGRSNEKNGLMGMVNYAAERSGCKYVNGREGWKTLIVSNLMYGCGALLYGTNTNATI